MSSSENLRAIQKPQPLQVLLRMQGLHKRLKKLKASKDLTQMVTTNPDFF